MEVDQTQFKLVSQWLKEVLQVETLPSFEINKTTVALLHDLALKNNRRDSDLEALLQELSSQTERFQKQADALGETLSWLHISRQELSGEGLQSLDNLSSLAILLDLKDVEPTSYMMALQALQEEIEEVQHASYHQQQLAAAFTEKTHTALPFLSECNRLAAATIEGLDTKEQVTEERLQEIKYLQQKSLEYHDTLQTLKNEIEATGVTPEFTHSALIQAHQQLQQVQQETDSLLTVLKGYLELPPDLALAELKVAEARQRFAAVEEEMQRHILAMQLDEDHAAPLK